jgi:hypothetical protein
VTLRKLHAYRHISIYAGLHTRCLKTGLCTSYDVLKMQGSPTLLGPFDWTGPGPESDDGNRSSFQNAAFFRTSDDVRSPETL